jgi:hypothetical protein
MLWSGLMVKYPLQCIVGGTLLLTLAFSLNDGSAAQNETRFSSALRVACDIVPVRAGESVRLSGHSGDDCFVADSKK